MSDTLEFVARSHRVAILSGLICVNDIEGPGPKSRQEFGRG